MCVYGLYFLKGCWRKKKGKQSDGGASMHNKKKNLRIKVLMTGQRLYPKEDTQMHGWVLQYLHGRLLKKITP